MVWARLPPTLSLQATNRDADPAWQGSDDGEADRRIQARLGQRARQKGLGMSEINIKKIHLINKFFMRETRCIAKANVLMEFIDAYSDTVKQCEDNGEKLDRDEFVYELQEQMWAFYTEEAMKAGNQMRKVAEA